MSRISLIAPTALAIFGGLILGYFFFSLQSPQSRSELHRVEIIRGQSFSEIAAALDRERVVQSATTFKLFALVTGSAHQLKPGVYVLDAASSSPSVLAALVKGPVRDVRVVLTEGMTVKDIEETLRRHGILTHGSFSDLDIRQLARTYPFLSSVKTLEGFLFPDTYDFFPGSEVETIAHVLLNNFQTKIWPILETHPDFLEKVILASIVEKEVARLDDRRVVAGILFKRLALGIPLQIDAAFTYVKCKGLFVLCERPAVARTDLDIPSAYNMYLHTGVPPTPISNPGREAILAVLHPTTSAFLYYLSDPKTKRTLFSATFDEHNDKRGQYFK